MDSQDRSTHIVIGTVIFLVATLPALWSRGLDPYSALLVAGPAGIILLALSRALPARALESTDGASGEPLSEWRRSDSHDFSTHVVIAIAVFLVATVPALLSRGLDPYSALLAAGPILIIALARLEQREATIRGIGEPAAVEIAASQVEPVTTLPASEAGGGT